MYHKTFLIFSLIFFLKTSLLAQPDRWQQRVDYRMDIDMDVAKHQFKGKQTLKYTNNSPDELDRVFFHLYFNAFQPGSNMDVRSMNLPDPDPRVRDRIGKLKPDEYGWHKINSLKMDGKNCKFEVNETILEVELPKAIKPNSTVEFEMDFASQVPLQIRRSGWNSADGIDFSMSQWYPKICEYDYQGWHANPYVAREFYGVWGDFDVNITIDRKYILGASGVLQNGGNIGYGYEPAGTAVRPEKGDKFTWHWKAENVHDFAWTADPDYKHVVLNRKDGLVFHFLYQDKEETRKTWEAAPAQMDKAFDFINEHFGQFPYKAYSFLEGGDGGMEYPMATFLAGGAGLGTFIHESLHAWYYGLLGSNESLYGWMDEGFTEYATAETENYLKQEGLLKGKPQDNPHLGANQSLIRFNKSGREEPLSIHSDHYPTNSAYSVGAYVKGEVILHQLQYIMGKPVFEKAMLTYFNTWKFKHPNPNDFIRVMEKESGLELDWFKEYFVYTTKTIDYGIKTVEKASRKETRVILENKGQTPMPLDITVTYKDGSRRVFNLPLDIMRGAKKGTEFTGDKYSVLPDWRWTHPTYEFNLDEKFKNIKGIEIDASQRLLDWDRDNNVWGKQVDEKDDED
ncbi:MAG: M1 family metallopeptidase [Saprospiraceae bacterium]|nr:M1 family metallopeptidase [Saprospiraceae bacterium]MCF8249705.1 M1 family metallopeptidase [Saprospiraceae bacterium]MCF8279864.1 M1 family metallopeptidase [Bacteroidales bacterium]MCF8312308.1 M1 family metallopeptidase [Saprospiraceae bacterium]MCF8440695.1 M1 family metallopeptidase [Saprospiraceae bacterium]